MKVIKNYGNKSFRQEHYPVVEMKAKGLIPTAFNWHKATDYKEITKLYKYHRPIYDSWLKQGLLPDYAIERVRNYQESLLQI